MNFTKDRELADGSGSKMEIFTIELKTATANDYSPTHIGFASMTRRIFSLCGPITPQLNHTNIPM